jgi:hypothetical protein
MLNLNVEDEDFHDRAGQGHDITLNLDVLEKIYPQTSS